MQVDPLIYYFYFCSQNVSSGIGLLHKQQFVSWIYLYAITAAAENTVI